MIDFDYLAKEYVKCFSDKSRIYMIQNYLKTFDGTQGKDVPFLLFPRQQVLCNTLGFGDASICTTKYRQAGITTVCAGFITCQNVLASEDSPITSLIIGNTLDLAQQMLYKIKNFLLQIPLWMWGEKYYDASDTTIDITKPPVNTNVIFTKCNGKEIILKNGCKIYARSSGPNAARGISACHYLIFDETAFIENGGEVFTSALPTTSSVNGKVIFVSTPNGKDSLYYETCRRAKLKGTSEWNSFDLVEMFWYQDPRYNRFLEWYRKKEGETDVEVLKEECTDKLGNVRYDEERWEKLISEGWKPRSPWYIKMCQQFNNDEQRIAQELDVSFLGSASNVIPPESIEMQQNLNNREPLKKGEDGDPLFMEDTWIWKRPIEGHRYICAADTSRGDSADRTAIEILDIDAVDENGMPTIEQVLEYHGKKTGDDIGEIIDVYGRLYGNAFVVVECIGGQGDAAALMLQRLKYPNLYYDDADLNKYTTLRERTKQNQNGDKTPGFHSSSVRFQMLTFFANMVRTNQIKIRSKRVVMEMETWIYKGDQGRIDHMDGCHDDTLTCLAMAVFVMQYSMNKLQAAKEKDAAFLKAWTRGAAVSNMKVVNQESEEISARPGVTKKHVLPIYSGNKNKKTNPYGAYYWVVK